MTFEVLRRSLFTDNDRAAEEIRNLLERLGIVAVNLMGGPGCGKTSIIERVIPSLRQHVGVAVLAGDIATTKDASRVAALGVPVIQLLTEGGSHLTATLVQQGIARLPLDDVDLLLIENVGCPVCPAKIDLGEHYRVVCLGATEGDDMPAKYPALFKCSDLVVFTRMDLEAMTNFDPQQAAHDIRALDPNKQILYTSSVRGASTQALADWLLDRYFAHQTEEAASRRVRQTRPHAAVARC
jgi:hydrogenase nickel incorporation protein HypB